MNKSKSKQQNHQLHKSTSKNEKSNIDIPHSKQGKLKVHKSTRPFGKDITNTFKQSYPYLGINPHLTNKLDNPLPQIINNNQQKKEHSPKKISSIISKGVYDSSKMSSSTANTKKNISGLNSINSNNNKKIARIPYESNYVKNKIKSSFTQAKISNSNTNTNNTLNPNFKSTMTNTNSYMKNVNNENINSNNINNYEKNQELINRLKNKTSALKYSITSKNYYINFNNNKNKGVKGFQLYEEPKIKNVEKKDDITKGINILAKYDTQKMKGKLHKTTYNYYFNKNENIKNTKSFDAKKMKKENKSKEKIHIIIEDKSKSDINKNEENININNNNETKNESKNEINKVKKEKSIDIKEKKDDQKENINNSNIDKKETSREKESINNSKDIRVQEKSKSIKSKSKSKNRLSSEKKDGKEKQEKENKSNSSHSQSKYKSPPKKSKSKKQKKHQKQDSSSKIPIEINCKPLSPKNNKKESSKSKDEDDLAPKYFNTASIKNVQIPKEYLNTIYYNLLKEQYTNKRKFKPEYNYMNSQNEINEQMRSILVDWIIDVHGKFGFTDETLYMTVLIIDRYSSIKKITRNEYQNLGISALMISCKHEEINVPKVEDFIYITDNAYNKEEVFNMEQNILNGLNYDLLYPSPIKFFEYLSLKFNFDKKQFYFGKYLMETFLLNLIWIKYSPSIIACAAAYIVMKFFKLKNYKESYQKIWYTIEGKEGFSFVEPRCGVKDCAQEMCNFVDNIGNTNYLSCQKKYESDECCAISKLILNYGEKDDKNKNSENK
jgi:hypothetical protein